MGDDGGTGSRDGLSKICRPSSKSTISSKGLTSETLITVLPKDCRVGMTTMILEVETNEQFELKTNEVPKYTAHEYPG